MVAPLPIIFNHRRYIKSCSTVLFVLIFFIALGTQMNHPLAEATTVSPPPSATPSGVPSSYPLDAHAWKPLQQASMHTASSGIYSEVRPQHLIAMFDFDTATRDASGYFKDIAPYGLTSEHAPSTGRKAVLHASVLVTPQGYIGGAVYFDGTSFAEINDFDISPMALPELTMGAWVKPSSRLAGVNSATSTLFDRARYVLTNENNDGIGGTDRGFGIDTRSGTTGWSAYNGKSSSSTTLDGSTGVLGSLPVVLNKWVFVAVTYSTTAVQLYVDGQMIESPCDMTGGKGSTSLRMGHGGIEQAGFHGTIDNVFVYDTVLKANELALLRNAVPTTLLPSAGSAGYAVQFFGPSDDSERMSTTVPRQSRDGYAAALSLAPQAFNRGITGVTVAVWVAPVALTDARQFVSLVDKSGPGTNQGKEYRLELYYEPNKQTTDVRFSLGDNEGKTWSVVWNTYQSVPIAPLWTHIAVVWNGAANNGNGYLGLYINGVLMANRTAVGPTTANAPSELNPGKGDLLVGAQRLDSTSNQLAGAPAPSLASLDTHSVHHGQLMSFFEGSMDELQIWHVARDAKSLAGTRSYHRQLIGNEQGLAGYWSFDEGYGMYSINSCGNHMNSRYGALKFLGGDENALSPMLGQPSFLVSNAVVGDQIEQFEDVETIVRLNATDAAGREVLFTITSLPATGSLHLFTTLKDQGTGLNRLRGDKISTVPRVLAAGVNQVWFVPSKDGHSAQLDTAGKAESSYTSFSYQINTLDHFNVSSPSSSAVRIFVDPVDDLPQFVNPQSVALQFTDYGIDDPDAWERKGGDFIDVTLSIHDTVEKNSLIPNAAKSNANIPAGAAKASTSSSDSRLSLGTTHALDFRGPTGSGDGVKDGATRFVGSLNNVNNALRDFTLVTPPVFGGTVSMQVDDQGDQGRGGALVKAHSLGVNLRAGTIPVIFEVFPASAPPTGGTTIVLNGANFHVAGSHVCSFGNSIRTNATQISPVQLRCSIPSSQNVGMTSLVVINDAGFSSNELQFLYEVAPTVRKIEPTTGPASGGTMVLILGEGFSDAGQTACRFDDVIVPALYVSSSVAKCKAPSRQNVAGLVNVAVSNNGHHFSAASATFNYEKPLVITAVLPSRGPSFGQTPVNARGLNFVNSSLLSCRFGTVIVSATFQSASSIVCVAPSIRAFGTQPLPFKVSLFVSNNGKDFISSRMPIYTYVSPVSVSSVSPNSGPVEGGTGIIVRGLNFVSTDVLGCRIGSALTGVVVPGRYLSPTMLRCVTPALPKGRVAVEITTNNVDYTNDAVQFEYKVQASVAAISPNFGPTTGGTKVVVSGAGFSETQELQCRFGTGGALTQAIWIAPTVIECITPSVASASFVALQITSNMVDFTSPTSAFYSYTEPAVVRYISPPEGPSRGGTLVTVVGTGFTSVNSAQLFKCQFGGVSVHAVCLNSTHLQCSSPAIVLNSELVKHLVLEVSMNGLQFTNQQVQFTMYKSIQLVGITPQTGPTTGNTSITVHGNGFINSPRLACLYGTDRSFVALATYISSTELNCITPAASPMALLAGASITVTNNGIDVSGSGALQFSYHKRPSISSISPSFGSARGGTIVMVRGANFVQSSALSCVVGGVTASAVQFLSSSAVLCTVGSMSIDTHMISISNNDLDYSSAPNSDAATFNCMGDIFLVSINPPSGSVAGGTKVHINIDRSIESLVLGSHLNNSFCFFGNIKVAAVWANNTTAQCIAPAYLTACSQPVQLSLNGDDMLPVKFLAEEQHIFTYMIIPKVLRVTPKVGSHVGGTMVYLTGSGYVADVPFLCRFGTSNTVSAVFSSPSLIRCPSPASNATEPVELYLSVNGIDFFSTGKHFFYSDSFDLGSLSPTNGPTKGGTTIAIMGSHFPAGEMLRCKFNHSLVEVSAKWVSGKKLTCIAPPASVEGEVSIRIVSSNADYTNKSLIFLYQTAPTIQSLSPTQGTHLGGGIVRITGSHFSNRSNTWCRFGAGDSAVVPAIVSNSTFLECIAPAQNTVGRSCVEISNNNVDYSNDCVSFEYTSAPSVNGLNPKHGITTGGTRVIVTGTNFRAGNMRCRFGGIDAIAAKILSNTTIECVTPSVVQGWVHVEISNNNGVDFTQNGLQFLFVEPPQIHYVYPESGPEAGSTLLMIGGSYLYSSTELACHFFDVASNSSVPVVSSNAIWVSSSAITCTSPSYRPATVRVSVSSNGQQHTDDNIQFNYHSRIGVTAVQPSRGSLQGGTLVAVKGTGFVNASRLSCRFDDAVVLATYISDTSISCTTPAHQQGISAVEVSNNGIDFSSENGEFEFVVVTRIVQISPRTGPTVGGTKLLVSGIGFRNSKKLGCRFVSEGNQLVTAAIFFSEVLIFCYTPAGLVGPSEVSITLDGIDFSSQSGHFVYYKRIVVTGINPSVGSERGGTVVTVQGSSFLASDALTCKFGESLTSKAEWLSSLAIRCTSPENAPGNVVYLEVSNNGIDFSTNNVPFRFSETPRVNKISPAIGSVYGGSRVLIKSSNLLMSDQYFCKFSGIERSIEATFMNSTFLECIAPAQNTVGRSCVEISNNNVDYSNDCVSFEYTSAPSVNGLNPKHGITTGGTRVIVTGTNFRAGNMRCRFGGIDAIAAKILSNTTIECVTPSVVQGWVHVEISNNNGVDFTQNGLQFLFVEPPQIHYVYPESGPEAGSTLLMIGGSYLYSSTELACHFFDVASNSSVPVVSSNAIWVSSSAITCTSPSYRPATVRVSVSSNGQQHTDDNIQFNYHSRIGVTAVQPSRGSLQGGTLVAVKGTGFVNASRLSCRFDDAVVLATYISDTSISCTTPAHQQGISAVEVSNNGIDFSSENGEFEFVVVTRIVQISPRTGPTVGGTKLSIVVGDLSISHINSGISCRFGGNLLVEANVMTSNTNEMNFQTLVCFSPTQAVGLVSLDLVVDNVDITRSDSKFLVYDTPSINLVRPSAVRAEGGSTITIHGGNFGNTESIFCRFGISEIVRAIWLADTLLECVAPAGPPGQVQVDITLNGVDYTNGEQRITYVTDTTISHAEPLKGTILGGTVVHVVGNGFTSPGMSSAPMCLFGHIQVEAYQYNATHASCKSPVLPTDMASRLLSSLPVSFDVINSDLLRTAADYSKTINGRTSIGTESSHWKFVYVPETTVTSVSPLFGPRTGNTLLQVFGIGIPLSSTSQVGCVFEITGFESIVVAASKVENSKVTCRTPSINVSTIVTVRLSVGPQNLQNMETADNAAVISLSSAQFTMHGPLHIVDIAPILGPENGGTTVTVSLNRESGVASFIPLLCLFGGRHAVPAHYIGPDNVQCTAPAHVPGLVHLMLQTVGENAASSNKASFAYHETMTIGLVTPSEAVGNGGTLLSIYGTNFLNISSLVCRFGNDATMPATFVSSLHIQCVSPVMSDALATNMIIGESTSVSIYISANGVEWTNKSPEKLTFLSGISQLVALSPSKGPSKGGTVVKITGSGFNKQISSLPQSSELLTCRFEGIGVVAATKISDNEIQCKSPLPKQIFANSMTSNVEIAFNGVDFTNSGLSFVYYSTPNITSIVPTLGSEQGGTKVRFVGVHFPKNYGNGGVICKFGDMKSSTVLWISDKTLECVAPSHNPGSVSVSLSFNGGVDFTDSHVLFKYQTAARIAYATPTSGSIQGNTLVSLIGHNFMVVGEHKSLFCKIGTSLTSAKLENDTTITCFTPPQEKTGSMLLRVVTEDGDFIWSDASLVFEYVPRLIVNHITPNWGSVGSETLLTIRCSGTRNMSTSVCLFRSLVASSNPIVVPATFLSSFRMTCTTPKELVGPARYAVEISNNGIDFSGNGLQYEVTEPVVLEHLLPSTGGSDGGTQIQVMGSGFINSTLLACRFGNNLVPAVFKSTFHVSCIAPAGVPDVKYVVGVTLNGVDFSQEGLEYQYLMRSTLVKVEPRDLSAQATDTLITVIGTSFHNRSGIQCNFANSANIVSVATFVNKTTIQCLSPVFATFATSVGEPYTYASSISVTYNGQDFTNALEVTVSRVPKVVRLTPSEAYAGASVRVNITGTNFRSGNSLSCGAYFKKEIMTLFNTIFVSPTLVTCEVLVPVGIAPESKIALLVSNNGYDYSSTGPDFIVRTAPRVSSIEPTLGSITGGTRMQVVGNAFPSRGLACRFAGLQDVLAERITNTDATVVTCLTPHFDGPGSVQFDLVVNGVPVVPKHTQLTFLVVAEFTVTKMLPLSGIITGGANVHLFGTGFRNVSTLSCSFDELVVLATYLSAHELTCTSPPHVTDSVHVSVSQNGVDFQRLVSNEFKYLAIPSVTSVQPRTSPLQGGVNLMVGGENFVVDSDQSREHLMCCFDGVPMSNATLVSSTLIRCNAIPHVSGSSNKVSVSVAVDGVDCSGPSTQLFYRGNPIIYSVIPATGIENGGTVVTISGTGFGFGFESFDEKDNIRQHLRCHFGETQNGAGILDGGVPATVLSDTRLQCTTPSSSIGIGPMHILVSSMGSTVVSGSQVKFTYVAKSFVSSYEPKTGPSSGASTVNIYGSNLAMMKTCHFGTKNVPANMISSDWLSCESPTNLPGNVSLVLSAEGNQDQMILGNYLYSETVTIVSIFPDRGPIGGGTRVLVKGTNFMNTESHLCNFGNDTTLARFISSTQLECTAPSAPNVSSTEVQTVDFWINENGHQKYINLVNVKFTYYKQPLLSHVIPHTVHEHSKNVIRIHGSNFIVLGEKEEQSTFQSALQCVSSGNVATKAVWLSRGVIECSVNVGSPGESVQVSVSMNNGLDWTATSASLNVAPMLTVTKLTPSTGYIGSQSSVVVHGSGFVNTTALSCMFGVVPADWIMYVSRTEVKCGVPRVPETTIVHVQISIDGSLFSSTSTETAFHFLQNPIINTVFPKSSALVGGNMITVTGSNFIDTEFLSCHFGPSAGINEQIVSAKLLNASAVQCILPSSIVPRLTEVQVSLDGHFVTNKDGEAALLRYLRAPVIKSVEPTVLYPGVLVTVEGQYFNENPHLGVHVGLQYLNTSQIVRISASLFRFVAPSHPPGPTLLSISYNEIGSTGSNDYVVEYKNVAEVTALSPSSGVAPTGGSVIAVTGTNFATFDGNILCRFTTMTNEPAQDKRLGLLNAKFANLPITNLGVYVSSNRVHCISPPQWLGGRCQLEISCNGGHDYTSSGMYYDYEGRTAVSEIVPTLGPATGGSLIIIKGENFTALDSNLISCAFGSANAVPGTILSDTRISCISPPRSTPNFTSVKFDLVTSHGKLNAKFLGESQLVYTYYANPQLLTLTPASIPSGSEHGVIIQVDGTGFFRSNNITCHVGNDIVLQAVYVSSTLIECMASLPLSMVPGRYNVDLSFNGGHDVLTGLFLAVAMQQEITKLVPNSGSINGGTLVTIIGRGFDATVTDLGVTVGSNTSILPRVLPFCRFGGIEVAASIVNATAIQCVAPPAEEASVNEQSYEVNLGVSLRFVNTKRKIVFNAPKALLFKYHAAAQVVSIEPKACTSRGGCTVEIVGTGFATGEQFTVQVSVVGTALNRSTVTTTHVSQWQTSSGQMKSLAIVHKIISSTRAQIILPQNYYGTSTTSMATLHVSNNGIDFSIEGPTFQYQADMIVDSVFPSMLPEMGETMLKIKGSYFTEPLYGKSQYKCAFGGTVSTHVDATWLSEKEMTCLAPAGKVGKRSLEISANGKGMDFFTKQAVQITYFKTTTVAYLVPNWGSEFGGTIVTVVGTNFNPQIQLSCIFGSTESLEPAVVVNATHAICIAPEISLDGMLPSSKAVQLRVVPTQVVEAYGGVTPTLLSVYTGTTTQTQFEYLAAPVLRSVTPKLGLASEAGAVLNIYGEQFPASHFAKTSINELYTSLFCRFTFVGMNVSLDGAATIIQSSRVVCLTPSNVQTLIQRGKTMTATLGLVLNNRPFSTNMLSFVFTADAPLVTSVLPTAGSFNGGTAVRVVGSNFIQSSLLSCRFGNSKPVAAKYVSSKVVLCIAPATNELATFVNVEVSLNRVSFTNNNIQFQYVSGAVILSTFPSSGPVTGGSNITVRIENMLEKDNTFCRFSAGTLKDEHFFGRFGSSVLSKATMLTTKSATGKNIGVWCTTPAFDSDSLIASRSETVELDVVYSKNGMIPEAVSVNGIGFTFYGQPELYSLYPSSGPISGGTKLTIHGSGFQSFRGDLEMIQCSFTGTNSSVQITIDADLVSSDTIVCLTPPWNISEFVVVETTLNGVVSPVDASGRQYGLQYTYYKHPTLAKLTPERGIFSRSNDIRVSFSDASFKPPINTSDLICDFGVPNITEKVSGKIQTSAQFKTTGRVVVASSTSTALATEVVCPTPVLPVTPVNEVQRVTVRGSPPSVDKQCIEVRKVSRDVDEVQTFETGITGQAYEVQQINMDTRTDAAEVQMIETDAVSRDEIQSLKLVTSPSIAEVQSIIVTADSQVQGTFKLKIHFPSIRTPIVVSPLDLSIADTHETQDLTWILGTDGPLGQDLSGGPGTASIRAALFPYVGDTSIFRHPSVSSGGSYTYRWDVTFTQLQYLDVGDVDLMVPVHDNLIGTNLQMTVVETVPATSKTYQKVALTPAGIVSGTFVLSFRGQATSNLAYDISSIDMKNELQLLSTVGSVTVTRTGDASAGFDWEIVFDDNIGILPVLGTNSGGLTNGVVVASTTFSSSSSEVGGTYTLSYGGSDNSVPIAHDASGVDVKSAIESITNMPAGLVTVTRSVADYNSVYEWMVTFTVLRGDLLYLIADVTSITCSRGVATGPLGLSDIVEFPRMNVTEQIYGTRVGGIVQLSLPATSVLTVDVESTETTMQTAVNSLLASAGFTGGITSVHRVGPNHDGAYQWYITIENLGNVPELIVSNAQMTCGSKPGSIAAGCNPTVAVGTITNGAFPWVQEISFDVSHVFEMQYITVASVPKVQEIQEIQIVATGGSFILSFGVHQTVSPIDLAPTSTLATRVTTALERLYGVGEVSVTLATPSNDRFNLAVTFVSINGNVPSVGIITNGLVHNTNDNGAIVITGVVSGTVVETVTGVACEEQALELLSNDPTPHGHFVCTFGSDITQSNPIAYNSSALSVQNALSSLPLLGNVKVSQNINTVSTTGTMYGPGYRRWDITFVNYVGEAAAVIACTASSAIGSSVPPATIRVTQTRRGEAIPAAGTFGLSIPAGASEANTAHSVGVTTSALDIKNALDTLETDAVHTVTREVFGYGAVNQYRYVVTWPASSLAAGVAGLTGSSIFSAGTLPFLQVDTLKNETVDEVQEVSLSSASNFILSFEGKECTNSFTSSTSTAADLQNALNALSTTGTVSVTSTGGPTSRVYSITFTSPISKRSAIGHALGNSHQSCMYDYERKQCRQSFAHAHSCRQHDGVGESECT